MKANTFIAGMFFCTESHSTKQQQHSNPLRTSHSREGSLLGAFAVFILWAIVIYNAWPSIRINGGQGQHKHFDYTIGSSSMQGIHTPQTYTPIGGKLNATDFQHWLMVASTQHTILTLATGNYSVSEPIDSQQHNSHIYLENLTSFHLDMSGVHLFMDGRHHTALYISGLENVSIKGVSIHYSQFPTNQALLTAIGADGKSLDVDVMAGYPLEDWQSGVEMTCYVFDPTTRWWKPGSNDIYGGTPSPLATGGSQAFRLHYDHDVGPTTQNIAVGDLIACRQVGGAFVVHTHDCSGVSWQDITLYGGPSFGFFEEYGVSLPASANGANKYVRCSVRRPERPANATQNALLSTSADGFHSTQMPVGPLLDSCYFEAMPDDGIAIHGRYSLVTDAFPHNHSFVIAERYGRQWYGAGSLLRVYDNEFQPAGVLTVQSTTIASQYYRPPHTTSHMLTELNITACAFIVVTVREDLPAGCGFDFIVSCPNRTGNGFQLRNNIVRYHRARGMLIKSSNGIIINNTVEGSTMAGLLMAPELYWGEADYAHNNTIQNNTFINTAYTLQGVAGIAIGAVGPNHNFATGLGHSDIRVMGNRFINISNTNVWITSARSVVLSGNVFDHPFPHTPWAQCCFRVPHDNLAWITQTQDIQLVNNCVFGSTPAMKKVLNTTTSVTGSGFKDGIQVKSHC